MFITKSLLKFQSDRSQKVYHFYKGNLQKEKRQASKYLVIFQLFLSKFVKFEILGFKKKKKFLKINNSWRYILTIYFFPSPKTFFVMHGL